MLRRASVLLAPALVLSLVIPAAAAGKKKAFTDPAKAGPDFVVQGEYVGTLKNDEEEMKVAAQVIALGEGEFRLVGYPGGLPGAGWDEGDMIEIQGEIVDGVPRFDLPSEDLSLVIKDGVLTVADSADNTIGTLKKETRKSPTLGAKPPAGAVVLFDGSTPDNFEGGRMTEDGLLKEGVTSKQKFGSFKLHLEFCTPFMPEARGQARGNSGFYAQGRYEVQILDSFGLEGLDNECGGAYSVGPPKVNMCFPPLSWQTYDIEFTAAEYKDGEKVKNARMTVLHNGVEIHKDREYPKATPAAPLKEGPEPGPVFLQDHGNPVRFRNIWVVEKK
jgi:hypothetical protein